MQALSSKPAAPWASPEAEVHTARSHSDLWSCSSRSVSGVMPVVSPKPAYVAQGPAEQLASSELDRPTCVLEPALDLVNSLLDYALFNLLTISRSTSLPALRQAVPKLLKARLGQAATQAAEEDLQDMADAGEELDLDGQSAELPAQTRSFDPELAWKLARLRTMSHVRLGDMEEEDCDDCLEEEGLDEYTSHPVLATGTASTFFLASVLDFLGEQALCLAAQFAENRHTAAIAKQATADSPPPDDRGPVIIDAVDMHALGREGPLSRLWRSWRRDARLAQTWNSRAETPPALTSPTWTESSRSRKSSLHKSSPREDSHTEPVPRVHVPQSFPVNGLSQPQASLLAGQPRSAAALAATDAAPTLRPRSSLSPILPSATRFPVRPQSLPPSAKAQDESRSEAVVPEPDSRTTRPENDGLGEDPAVEALRSGHPGDGTAETTPLTRSANTSAAQPSVDNRQPELDAGGQADPARDANSHRAVIISGAVGAIAGALGIEAMRSAQQSRQQKEPDSTLERQVDQSVATEINSTSHPVGAANSNVSAAINKASGVHSTPNPLVAKGDDFDRRPQPEEQVSRLANDHGDLHSRHARPIRDLPAGNEVLDQYVQHDRQVSDLSTTSTTNNNDHLDQYARHKAQVSDLTTVDDYSDIRLRHQHSISDLSSNDDFNHHLHNDRPVSELTVINDYSDHNLHLHHEQTSHVSSTNDRLQAFQQEPQVSHTEGLDPTPTHHEPPSAYSPLRKAHGAALDGAADQDDDHAAQQIARPQQSLSTNPTDVKREAAIIDEHVLTPTRDPAADLNTPTAPLAQASAITRPESASQYSRSDRNSPSVYSVHQPVPSQRHEAVPSPALAQQAAPSNKSLPGTASISRSSNYSQQSHASQTSSNKRLALPREQDSSLSHRRVDNSPTTHEDHVGTGVGVAAAAAAVTATAAAGTSALAVRRQHVAVRSDVEHDPRQPSGEEKKKSLEILINSDETLHYTLTPESARPQDANSRSPTKVRTQTQELADFFRTTAPPGEGPVHYLTTKASGSLPRPGQSRTPDQLLTPVEQRASQRTATQANFRPRPLGVPRDARPERNTTRDLADYARSTGPSTDAQLPQALAATPRTARFANGPVSPTSVRSTSSLLSLSTAKSASRLHYEPRDPRAGRGTGTSDLAEFIREGPPQTTPDRRSGPRTPLRSTLDSEEYNNVRGSVGSARNGSIITSRSVQESTNSRTGLLDSQRNSNRVNGVSSASAGIAKQTIPEVDRMPARKRRGPRDPYAIDDSDEEALEEELAKAPPPKQESLIDFLRNTAPPPGMSTLPVLAAVSGTDNKLDGQSSSGPSKLRDLVGRSKSVSYAQSTRSSRSTKPSNGARETSPHLTQVGSKLDKYRPTQTTHAAHVDRNRQKARYEPRTASADIPDYSEPAASPEVYTYRPSPAKDQNGFFRLFKWRGSVKR